ncbi:U6 snRNA-associated Sm-like protein LSm2 [Sphaerodactylus townsendi]|uniref:U6 snRNA-associated Sm-like protein LSm2 n=1 Tax=Sphaerodactylus townsendi TaxID=933632 RepID=UPI0020270A6B|nr:U6 snRNA-associated Sm-like protein LSm2 [Sphaerodactylus townsendi]
MLFYSFFKSLVGKDMVEELKNDLSICGALYSVDQYLNIKFTDISVTDPEKYSHMLSVKTCSIRGSVIHYVQLLANEVDTQPLQDVAHKEAKMLHTAETGMVSLSFFVLLDLPTYIRICDLSMWHWP